MGSTKEDFKLHKVSSTTFQVSTLQAVGSQSLSCAVNYIYYSACKGILKLPLSEPTILLPGLPVLKVEDTLSCLSEGVVRREAIEICIKRVLMDGEEKKAIKASVDDWKSKAREAIDKA
ncbi:hypothetical protein ACFE04_009667 [Oxalis oulophora]